MWVQGVSGEWSFREKHLWHRNSLESTVQNNQGEPMSSKVLEWDLGLGNQWYSTTVSGGSARKSCLPGSYSQEEPWKAVGRNSLKEGWGVQAWTKDNGSLSEGTGGLRLARFMLLRFPLALLYPETRVQGGRVSDKKLIISVSWDTGWAAQLWGL